MTKTIARHAHALEDKVARRTAILKAASKLFTAGTGSLPTAAEIASVAGLAKGTVYLYFRSKEEIFAALLLEGWGAVMLEGELLFQVTKGNRSVKIAAFLSALVAHLEDHSQLLRLDALGYGVLEKNMLHDALVAHKAEYTARLERTGSILDAALRLPAGRGLQLLMRTYALTKGLWQSYQDAEHSGLPHVAQSLSAKPFGTELHEALTEYWRGALANSAPKAYRSRSPISRRLSEF